MNSIYDYNERVNRCKPCPYCVHGKDKDYGKYFCSKSPNINVLHIKYCEFFHYNDERYENNMEVKNENT